MYPKDQSLGTKVHMLHGGHTSCDCITCDRPPSVRRRHSAIGWAVDYICRGLNREHRKMYRSGSCLVLVQAAATKPVKVRNHLVRNPSYTKASAKNTDIRLDVGADSIQHYSEVVPDLGVFLDSELTMRQHVGKVAGLCYYHLRRLKKVCRILGPTIMSRLVSAFVTSHLNYCNALLPCIPQSTIAQLQRVQNAAVSIVSNLRPRDEVSASLHDLHWLPIWYRIIYKLWLMMHNAHVGRSPRYMLTATVHLPNRNRLRSSASTRYKLPGFVAGSENALFRTLDLHPASFCRVTLLRLWTLQHL